MLLLSPKFAHKENAIYFSKLFKNSVHSWRSRIAVYKAFLTGSSLYQDKQKKFCGITPVIRELLETGFRAFDPDRDSISKTALKNGKILSAICSNDGVVLGQISSSCSGNFFTTSWTLYVQHIDVQPLPIVIRTVERRNRDKNVLWFQTESNVQNPNVFV